MKKEHKDIDMFSRELLSKSLLKPVSSNFDDQLMDKIRLAPSPAKVKTNGKSVKKAWIYWIMAVAFLLISVLIISEFTGGYFIEVRDLFKLTFNYVLYGGMVLLIPLVLYQLDTLIQLMFWKKNGIISIT
ncbi:MAG: hypothetical protein KAI99_22790 [Cyclobacteriaceae bacterium]|nr:hypothetical protein [Cyclobacteriaceae bacterium]